MLMVGYLKREYVNLVTGEYNETKEKLNHSKVFDLMKKAKDTNAKMIHDQGEKALVVEIMSYKGSDGINDILVTQKLMLPLRTKIMKFIEIHHSAYYDNLLSGKGNLLSVYRILGLSSKDNRLKTERALANLTKIAEVLHHWGIPYGAIETKINNIQWANKREMAYIKGEGQTILTLTKETIEDLLDFQDLQPKNKSKLKDDPTVLGILNWLGTKGFLTTKQIGTLNRTIKFFQVNDNKVVPKERQWKWGSLSEKTLRSKVIRLAHSKPELREHLLPLIADKTAEP